MLHKVGWADNRTSPEFVGRVIRQIAGDEKIRCRGERNRQKWFIIRIRETQG